MLTVVLYSFLLFAGSYGATVYTWKPSDTNSSATTYSQWGNSSNWSPQGVPGEGDSVIFKNEYNNVSIPSDVIIASLKTYATGGLYLYSEGSAKVKLIVGQAEVWYTPSLELYNVEFIATGSSKLTGSSNTNINMFLREKSTFTVASTAALLISGTSTRNAISITAPQQNNQGEVIRIYGAVNFNNSALVEFIISGPLVTASTTKFNVSTPTFAEGQVAINQNCFTSVCFTRLRLSTISDYWVSSTESAHSVLSGEIWVATGSAVQIQGGGGFPVLTVTGDARINGYGQVYTSVTQSSFASGFQISPNITLATNVANLYFAGSVQLPSRVFFVYSNLTFGESFTSLAPLRLKQGCVLTLSQNQDIDVLLVSYGASIQSATGALAVVRVNFFNCSEGQLTVNKVALTVTTTAIYNTGSAVTLVNGATFTHAKGSNTTVGEQAIFNVPYGADNNGEVIIFDGVLSFSVGYTISNMQVYGPVVISDSATFTIPDPTPEIPCQQCVYMSILDFFYGSQWKTAGGELRDSVVNTTITLGSNTMVEVIDGAYSFNAPVVGLGTYKSNGEVTYSKNFNFGPDITIEMQYGTDTFLGPINLNSQPVQLLGGTVNFQSTFTKSGALTIGAASVNFAKSAQVDEIDIVDAPCSIVLGGYSNVSTLNASASGVFVLSGAGKTLAVNNFYAYGALSLIQVTLVINTTGGYFGADIELNNQAVLALQPNSQFNFSNAGKIEVTADSSSSIANNGSIFVASGQVELTGCVLGNQILSDSAAALIITATPCPGLNNSVTPASATTASATTAASIFEPIPVGSTSDGSATTGTSTASSPAPDTTASASSTGGTPTSPASTTSSPTNAPTSTPADTTKVVVIQKLSGNFQAFNISAYELIIYYTLANSTGSKSITVHCSKSLLTSRLDSFQVKSEIAIPTPASAYSNLAAYDVQIQATVKNAVTSSAVNDFLTSIGATAAAPSITVNHTDISATEAPTTKPTSPPPSTSTPTKQPAATSGGAQVHSSLLVLGASLLFYVML